MKRIDRQKGALARFKILPFSEWANNHGVVNPDSEHFGQKAQYEHYLDRKEQERATLINRTSSY